MDFVALHSEPLCAGWWLAILAAGVIAGVFGLTEKSKNMPKEKEKNLPQVATGGGGNGDNGGNGGNPFEELKRMLLETQQQLLETRQHLEKRIDGLATQVEKMEKRIKGLASDIGDVKNTLGEISEFLALPAVENFLKENGYSIEHFSGNVLLKRPNEKDPLGELDFFAVVKKNGAYKIILGEVKTTLAKSKLKGQYLEKPRGGRRKIESIVEMLSNVYKGAWSKQSSILRMGLEKLPEGIKDLSPYIEVWGVFATGSNGRTIRSLQRAFSNAGVPLRIFKINNKYLSLVELGVKKKTSKKNASTKNRDSS